MEEGGAQLPVPPRILLERLRSAADAGDLEEVRRLCHPEALLVLRISDGRALSLDDPIALLRLESEAGEHEPTHYYVDSLDEHAAIALGYVTRQGIGKHLCWLLTFVDGLVYRQALLQSPTEAQAAYAELGLELGMPSAGAALPVIGRPATG